MKYLFSAALLVTFAAPASAGMMKCSSDNMAKSNTMMQTMPDGAGKMGMGKEMGMANGNVQGQYARRMYALHEGSENGHDEVGWNEDVIASRALVCDRLRSRLSGGFFLADRGHILNLECAGQGPIRWALPIRARDLLAPNAPAWPAQSSAGSGHGVAIGTGRRTGRAQARQNN